MQGNHDHRRVCGRLKVTFAAWSIEPAFQKSSLARKSEIRHSEHTGISGKKKMVWVILANGFSEPQKSCPEVYAWPHVVM